MLSSKEMGVRAWDEGLAMKLAAATKFVDFYFDSEVDGKLMRQRSKMQSLTLTIRWMVAAA